MTLTNSGSSNTSSNLRSIAFIVPRYGASIGGGAETLIRELVLNVFSKPFGQELNIGRVEVWTTCALDHRTWENYFEEGIEEEGDVTIRRFPVGERNLESFIRFEHAMQEGRSLTLSEQILWLENGVNSEGLYRHIAKEGPNFDHLVFAPYLFPTSFWGALIYPEKSILIPCLHDEHYAYLDVFRCLFSRVQGLFFNASPEKTLAESIYKLDSLADKSFVVGMGFDISSEVNLEPKNIEKNYILYTGRKETGKGLDLLIRCFSEYRNRKHDSNLELLIIGSGKIEFLDSLPEGVRDLGFVSEEEKLKLMTNALVLCQPSINESFSIVLMEAWLKNTPVLVNSDCAVTKYHVSESGGGLCFSGNDDFCDAIEYLRTSPDESLKMGNAGKSYVSEKYCWPAVRARVKNSLEVLNGLETKGSSHSRVVNERRSD